MVVSDDSETYNLTDLPPEILLKVFSFIDIRSLFNTVIVVCKHFHALLSGDGWRSLFALKWEVRSNLSSDFSFSHIEHNKNRQKYIRK